MPTDRLPRPAGWVLAVLLVMAAGNAAATAPELEVVVPEIGLQVGDRLPIRVMARGGEDLLWGELQVPTNGTAWAVVEGPRALAGSQPPAWELTMVPLLVGSRTLPELSVTVRSAHGTVTLATPPVAVTITSVLPSLPAGEEVAPAPLRDPIGATGLPWEWLLPGLLASLPLVTMLGWWWQRRRSELAGASGLPPFAELRTLLEALRLSISHGHEPAERICDHIAAGVRRFLERRTGEPAQEMTTAELCQAGKRLAWPEVVQRSLHQVMVVADGVRFARRPASQAELGVTVEAALVVGRELEAHLVPDIDTDTDQPPQRPGLAS